MNGTDVVGAVTMFIGVVVAEVRLHYVRAEQRVRHKRARQSSHAGMHAPRL